MIKEFFYNNKQLTIKWMYLSIIAVAIAGIYSILIVLARTPQISHIIPINDFFKVALVIHVDCSVLIWFMASAMMLIANIIARKYLFIANFAFYMALTGLILIFVSPFIAEGRPILNNYIPMLNNVVFIFGLVFFLSAIFISCLIAVINIMNISDNCLYFTTYVLALTILICFAAIIATNYKILNEYDFVHFELHDYYETFFWPVGHLLQFVYTSCLAIVIYIFGRFYNFKLYFSDNKFNMLIITNLIFVLLGFYPFGFISLDDSQFNEFYTKHMIYLGGIVPTIISCDFLINFCKSNIKTEKHYNYGILLGIFLFFIGGLIGILINGINVTIPAHYHGSTVGITIIFMTMLYYLFAVYKLNIINIRLIKLHLFSYAIGQFLHIMGLAISGGYGALRKDPNGKLVMQAKIGMGIMGIGGLVAILAGILFIYNCYLALGKKDFNEKEYT